MYVAGVGSAYRERDPLGQRPRDIDPLDHLPSTDSPSSWTETPSCKSMPLVRRGLTLLILFVVRHINNITLLFGSAAPVKRKGARGEVHSRRPRYYVPCSI